MTSFSPWLTRKVFKPQDETKVVAKEKWGRLEQVHDGVWALISTPFDSRDFTTVCNGGIIAGDRGVLAVEAFMQDAGASWLAKQSETLTGKRPTDVVCTHYHADHTAGHKGFAKGNLHPNIWLTEATQKAAEKSLVEQNPDAAGFQQVKTLDARQPTEIDLGNRKVKIVPRSGHTASDVTIELVDPKVIWSGDLFFNRMFPNYSDAIPNQLNRYASQLLASKGATIVPGHGPIADHAAVKSYENFLEFVESSARAAHKSGMSVDEATKDFKLPDSLKDWLIWSPDVAKRGFAAWFRLLEDGE